MRTYEPAAVEILDACECLRLLATMPVGRLIFTQGGLPVIRLVDFWVDGETIVFACDDRDSLPAAHRGDVVAFEVDALDPVELVDRRWTVTSIGHLSVVPAGEAAELVRVGPA